MIERPLPEWTYPDTLIGAVADRTAKEMWELYGGWPSWEAFKDAHKRGQVAIDKTIAPHLLSHFAKGVLTRALYFWGSVIALISLPILLFFGEWEACLPVAALGFWLWKKLRVSYVDTAMRYMMDNEEYYFRGLREGAILFPKDVFLQRETVHDQ